MKPFLSSLVIVFKKEWHDALRDKRSLRMAFLPPVYFAAIFVATVFFVIHFKNTSTARVNEPIELPVLGAEHLPAMVDWLEEKGIRVNPADADAYAQVEQKELDYALIIPAEAAQEFASGESATVWLVYDATNNKVQGSIGFIRQQLWSWNGRMGSLRLLARGISPSAANPLAIREMNIASDEKMGFFVLASLPMFLVLLAFIGSVGFSADMTAGERERRSLESLLITPAKSLAIIGGKWLTSLLITLAVLLLEVLLLAIAFAYVPFDELGLRVDVTPLDLLGIFALLVPLAFLAIAMQLSIAIFARSFKDAQTYIGLLVFIPMLPMFYTLVNPSAYEPWFNWVPVLGQQAMIKELLMGAVISWWPLVQFWLVALPLSGLLLWFTAWQLRKPKIVYGVLTPPTHPPQ
jgi:sodium transport system permease protein